MLTPISTNSDRKTACRGCPVEGSVWRRKLSGLNWRVLWHSERGIFIRLDCGGYVEIECHEVIPFFQAFEPVVNANDRSDTAEQDAMDFIEYVNNR